MAEKKSIDLIPLENRCVGTGRGSEEDSRRTSQKIVEEHPCYGCNHFYGIYYINYCCNYIFDMGRPRPCPPGELCTERNEDKEFGEQEKNRRKRLDPL